MNTSKPQPTATLPTRKPRGAQPRAARAPAANAVLNAQNRRKLTQHYRAKYGVK